MKERPKQNLATLEKIKMMQQKELGDCHTQRRQKTNRHHGVDFSPLQKLNFWEGFKNNKLH